MSSEFPGFDHESKELRAQDPVVSFFFSAHKSPEDYDGMKAMFDEADTFIVELHAWRPEDLEILRAISSGERVPRHRTEGREPEDASELEDEWLYGSHKRVEIIDVPEDHPLAQDDDGTSLLQEIVNELFYRGNVHIATQQLMASAKQDADSIERRDAFLEEQLRSLLERMKKEDMPPKRILIQLGSSHTGVSHAMRKEGKAQKGQNETRFDFFDELVRTYRFHKKPTQELITHALAELMLKQVYFQEVSAMPYLKRVKWLREQLVDVDQTKLTALVQQMEEKVMTRVVMGDEEDTPELLREMFEEAWKHVMTIDHRN